MKEERFRGLKDLFLFPVLIVMVFLFTIILVGVELCVRAWGAFRRSD